MRRQRKSKPRSIGGWRMVGGMLEKVATLNEDGYPDVQTLTYISEWEPGYKHTGFIELMAFIKPIWRYSDIGYWEEEIRESLAHNVEKVHWYQISTGGWSGNESIIKALKETPGFFLCCHESWLHGGHYVFKINVLK